PGQLARVAGLLAEANANVIEVLHTRHGSGMQISEVELRLSVETRGPEHREAVVDVLRHAGYDPKGEVDQRPPPRRRRPPRDAQGPSYVNRWATTGRPRSRRG